MNYTNLFLLSVLLLGIFAHNLVKIDSINRKTNGEFKLGPFLRLEWPSILLSVIIGIVCLMAKHEIKELEAAGKWLALSFFVIGYTAQSLLYKVMGKAEKIINDKTGS
jgi:hypothetical protein